MTSSIKHLEESSKDGRISNLPHYVLCHILSFLPTLDAISTSVLSSRWKNIWKDITKVNFDYTLVPFHPDRFCDFVERALNLYHPKYLEKFTLRCWKISNIFDVKKWFGLVLMRGVRSLDFCVESRKYELPSCIFSCKTLEELRLEGVLINIHTNSCLPNLKTMELQSVVFADIEFVPKLFSSCTSLESLVVDSVTWFDFVSILADCSSTLKEIRLKLSSYPPNLEVCDNVIVTSAALRHLNLSVDLNDQRITLSRNVFTFESLEVLVLGGHFLICDSGPICLPKLRILKLVNVVFEHKDFASKLICSCASLESLEISSTPKTKGYELNILSSTLIVLRIKFSFDGKLVIDAPALQHLHLDVYLPNSYEFRNLFSLEEANINFQFHPSYSKQHGYGVSKILYEFGVVNNILQTIRNVKILTLTVQGDASKIHVPEHAFPIFHRLTMLNLKVACCRWVLLFIKNSNNLEHIDISMFRFRRNNYERGWRNPMVEPACLFSTLRSITINGFKNLGSERAMAKYFIERARIMRRTKILFYDSLKSNIKMGFQCNLLNLRRGSEKCEISFSDT